MSTQYILGYIIANRIQSDAGIVSHKYRIDRKSEINLWNTTWIQRTEDLSRLFFRSHIITHLYNTVVDAKHSFSGWPITYEWCNEKCFRLEYGLTWSFRSDIFYSRSHHFFPCAWRMSEISAIFQNPKVVEDLFNDCLKELFSLCGVIRMTKVSRTTLGKQQIRRQHWSPCDALSLHCSTISFKDLAWDHNYSCLYALNISMSTSFSSISSRFHETSWNNSLASQMHKETEARMSACRKLPCELSVIELDQKSRKLYLMN